MRKSAPRQRAGEADEDGLHGVRVELQDVEGGQGEDGARRHRPRDAADPGHDHVLEQRRATAVDAREADREDRDRNGGFHHLAHLQAGVGRGHREDDAEEEAPAHRADRGLRHRGRGRDDRPVLFAGGERQVGVRGEGSGVGSVHSASGARAGRASLLASPAHFKGEAVAFGSAAGPVSHSGPRPGGATRMGSLGSPPLPVVIGRGGAVAFGSAAGPVSHSGPRPGGATRMGSLGSPPLPVVIGRGGAVAFGSRRVPCPIRVRGQEGRPEWDPSGARRYPWSSAVAWPWPSDPRRVPCPIRVRGQEGRPGWDPSGARRYPWSSVEAGPWPSDSRRVLCPIRVRGQEGRPEWDPSGARRYPWSSVEAGPWPSDSRRVPCPIRVRGQEG